jgi:hypothetical protein
MSEKLYQIHTESHEGEYTKKELAEIGVCLTDLQLIEGEYYDYPSDYGFSWSENDQEYYAEESVVICRTPSDNCYSAHEDDVIYVENEGEYFLDDQRTRDYFGIVYCENLGEWTTEPEGYDNGQHNLREYHSNNTGDFSGGSRFTIGFEVEKEDDTFCADFRDVEPHGWTIESDGSLNDPEGFELISPILPLDNMPLVFNHIDKMSQYIDAAYTSNCGGHIHIADKKRNTRELLESIKGYEPLLLAMYPHRKEENYCKAKKFDDYVNDPEKYSAIYKKSQTVELRIFPSPRNTSALKFRAALCLFMMKNPARKFTTVVSWLENPEHKFSKLMGHIYSREKIEQKIELIKRYVTEKEDVPYGERKKPRDYRLPAYSSIAKEYLSSYLVSDSAVNLVKSKTFEDVFMRRLKAEKKRALGNCRKSDKVAICAHYLRSMVSDMNRHRDSIVFSDVCKSWGIEDQLVVIELQDVLRTKSAPELEMLPVYV